MLGSSIRFLVCFFSGFVSPLLFANDFSLPNPCSFHALAEANKRQIMQGAAWSLAEDQIQAWYNLSRFQRHFGLPNRVLTLEAVDEVIREIGSGGSISTIPDRHEKRFQDRFSDPEGQTEFLREYYGGAMAYRNMAYNDALRRVLELQVYISLFEAESLAKLVASLPPDSPLQQVDHAQVQKAAAHSLVRFESHSRTYLVFMAELNRLDPLWKEPIEAVSEGTLDRELKEIITDSRFPSVVTRFANSYFMGRSEYPELGTHPYLSAWFATTQKLIPKLSH